MQKINFLLLFVVVSFTACQPNFKKGEKGLEYKIISTGSGEKLKAGDFMKMEISQIANNGKKDSILNDTRQNSGAVIEQLDSNTIPPEYYKVIAQAKKGDSIVFRILTDSMFAQNPGAMPSFFKKGCYYTTTVKLVDVFHSAAQADSARAADREIAMKKDSIESVAMMAKDDKTLQDYFKKNNIHPTKTALGTYVLILQPGTGPNADTSVVVSTNYTGRLLDGKMFDSNTDPSKGHVEPFDVNLTNDRTLGGNVIKGWKDGLQQLNKGAKAKFFIPSSLAYGKQRAGAEITPNSILVFDIEVVDIISKEKARAATVEKMKSFKLKQKLMIDSMAKLKKADAKGKE